MIFHSFDGLKWKLIKLPRGIFPSSHWLPTLWDNVRWNGKVAMIANKVKSLIRNKKEENLLVLFSWFRQFKDKHATRRHSNSKTSKILIFIYFSLVLALLNIWWGTARFVCRMCRVWTATSYFVCEKHMKKKRQATQHISLVYFSFMRNKKKLKQISASREIKIKLCTRESSIRVCKQRKQEEMKQRSESFRNSFLATSTLAWNLISEFRTKSKLAAGRELTDVSSFV